MLRTPLGDLRILVNGESVPFTPEVHPTAWPVAGCYRVRLRGRKGQELSCSLENAGLAGMGSSGEGYQAMDFIRGSQSLTIGTETDREDRLVWTAPDGITLRLLKDGEVVFGIAWAEDHRGGDDVRTWFAADSTLD